MTTAWKELGFRSYDAYIKSRLWWNIRQLVLERDGKCCQVCGTPSKTVHHIEYTKIVMLGQGDQHELITLCEPCHSFVEQDKRIVEKRSLLNKLFCHHSTNTLDDWQTWAIAFNTDIGYSEAKILEPKNHVRRKKQKNKKQQPSVKTVEEPKSELQSLRNDIDFYIKRHKKKKKQNEHNKKLVPFTEESRKEFFTNIVRKYNRKSKKNINKYLDKNYKWLDLELLFKHPEASIKLQECIKPYLIRIRNKETVYQKKRRLEQEEIKDILYEVEYKKIKKRKAVNFFGKLPNLAMNHKAKSFQGKSALAGYVTKLKEKTE